MSLIICWAEEVTFSLSCWDRWLNTSWLSRSHGSLATSHNFHINLHRYVPYLVCHNPQARFYNANLLKIQSSSWNYDANLLKIQSSSRITTLILSRDNPPARITTLIFSKDGGGDISEEKQT
jgi:hypothetical protein